MSERLITNRIAEQAQLRPNQVALANDAAELTYAELERKAAHFADYLWSRGIREGAVVALGLERSPDFVVAALAVMKCGAAYLPLDPAHPEARSRFMMRDAGVVFVVTNNFVANRFNEPEVNVITLDAGCVAPADHSIPDVPAAPTPEHLAYVIYTSGSTGQPKGVEITHRSLSNLIDWHVRAFELNESARASFQSGVGFDAAVWEIWPHLAIGATIYLPDELTRLSAEALRHWLVAKQITISFVPTVLAEQLITLPWPEKTALRFLLTGADTLHRFPPTGLPFIFVNNYGPTECTVVATSGVVGDNGNHGGLPSIGRPIENVLIHILDEQRREVPDGALGEIYIGGAGLARGYRNHPELTAERFVLCGGNGDRLYRTGDLGRRLPGGELGFLGRIDDQVKIRGHRIELGEINSVLAQQPAVRASAVIVRDDVGAGEKQLVAYVVPSDWAQADEQSLRHAIRDRLPDYMQPSAVVWMESLPLTTNGKIDRAALPAPSRGDGKFVAPRSPVEERLAGIIAELLKVGSLGIDDDIFQLGAHSLLGAQIIARVHTAFGAELKLRDVFDAPTVAQLAARIEQALAGQLVPAS